MAELLVRVVDLVNTSEPQKTPQLTKAGNVIVVCPDGWTWGKLEVNSPDWCIIKVPNMTVMTAAQFLGPQTGDVTQNPNLTTRAAGITLSALPVSVSAGNTYTMTQAQIMAAKTVYAVLAPPQLGPSTTTL